MADEIAVKASGVLLQDGLSLPALNCGTSCTCSPAHPAGPAFLKLQNLNANANSRKVT